MKKIILASQSPRRRELLSLAGYEFEICPSEKEEIVTQRDPEKVVMELSKMKALDIFEKDKRKDILVIGADTIVSIDNEILGKPTSRQEAYDMIKRLQGRSHDVYTGVTFVWEEDSVFVNSFYERTKVHFYPMSEEEITAYVSTGDGDDKAGSYGIQSKCAKYIKGIDGDYNNVVGLPIARIYQELKNSNIEV